jgi:hypothetical protein
VAAPYGTAGGLVVLVTKDGLPVTRVSEFYALAVTGQPRVEYTPVSELVILATIEKAKVVTHVSEFVALVTYTSEATERFDNRSWGFTLDQHAFYVLHLGSEGTFVYDALTTEWSQWKTEGFVSWNAENGVTWNDEIYFGGAEDNVLWRMVPTSFLDEDFRTIKRVVTGGIPAEARDTLRTGMFVLSATNQGTLDDESTPYVQLSISDDGGNTFTDREALTLDGSATQDFSWRGLGTIRAPGRVFKITDEGGFVTIKGADQKIAGEE